MRASELIKELQKIIESDGDLDVGIYQYEFDEYIFEIDINKKKDYISLE